MLPTPFKPPKFEISQQWHHRFHKDPGNAWLREAVAAFPERGSDRVLLIAPILNSDTDWSTRRRFEPTLAEPIRWMGRKEELAMVRLLWFVIGIVSAVLAPSASAQQEWPGRPIKFIVPTPPGGGTDVYARSLATTLADLLKQPLAVENRPGAGGNIGAEFVAKAAPDGYTFVSATGTMVVNLALVRGAAFRR